MIRRLFSLTMPVDRRFYAIAGFALMIAKYAIDTAIIYRFTGELWTPLDYLNPVLVMREATLRRGPDWLVTALAIWALPFMWIGVTMTIRRAIDAGYSGWIGLLFFVPIANYMLMLSLVFAPSAPAVAERVAATGRPPPVDDRIKSALLGLVLGVSISLGMLAFSVFVLGSYGMSLFAGTPFIVGATSGWLFNRYVKRTVGGTLIVALATILISSGATLLFALEGIVCLAMAFPLAAGMAMLGALAGRAIATGRRTSMPPAQTALVFLSLPFLTGAEAKTARAPLREVLSTIEVRAPPEAVWKNVIGFSDLPPPSEAIFSLGIAYPLRAKIVGTGPGAVRHCEFSTGPFVEPITVWEEPTRLAFDVRSQPPAMKEWSPYRHVVAPHLDGYIRSKRGEFRLIAIDGGKTRVEARTWYELEIFPAEYWSTYSDALIGAIHQRVLAHVRALSETPAP
jgi:uncharacterized membrane protein YhaH (DUF805 family)